MKKSWLSLLLVLSLTASVLAGCGKEEVIQEEPEEIQEVEEEEETSLSVMSALPDHVGADVTIEASPEMYPEIDMSEPYTVNMLLIGYEPDDWDRVLGLVNDYLADYNTSLEVEFLPWAEYQDTYQDKLHSGDKIDLVFTAPWCYMYTESAKDTFYTLDSRFAANYMPLTYKYQASASWDETTLYGKTVAVPANTMDNNGKIVAIRQDIADELGIEELTSWDDYKNYMLEVAENVTPETGIYALAAEGENKELWDQYRQQYDVFYALESDYVSMMYRYDGDTPSYDDISFTYETDIFKDYAYDMKELADAGAWSGSALYGDVSDDEAFAALDGASISWNKSVFTYVSEAEKNEGVECGVYFLTPGHAVATEAYSNNDVAIMANSQNPERAAMVLDLMKFDTYLNHLLILGVEGDHYSIDSEGRYTELDNSEAYPAGYISLSWAIKNGDVTELYADSREEEILDEMDEYRVACPTVTFVFDDSAVEKEMEAVDEILVKYVPRIQLGMVTDVDAEISTMLDRCYSCGLQEIKDEYKSQYEDWLATR